jgi:hypothetical protein
MGWNEFKDCEFDCVSLLHPENCVKIRTVSVRKTSRRHCLHKQK